MTPDEAISVAERAAQEWQEAMIACTEAGARVQEALSQLSAVMAIEKAKENV